MLVEGSPEDLAFFKQTMNAPDKWGDVKVLSEEPLIPYPEEFREQDKRLQEWKVELDEYARISPEKAREYEEQNPQPKDGYNSGGYEWEQDNYGCKWGFEEAEIVGETENSLSYVFDSAWAPPNKLFALMGEKFPSLRFTIDYEEEGMGFAGTYEIQGDDISNSPREIGERCPECDNFIGDCMCGRCPDCGKLLMSDVDPTNVCDCEAKKKKEQEISEIKEEWKRHGTLSMPNIDYKMLAKSGLKKKATFDTAEVNYNGKHYVIEFYEEGGHNVWQFSVKEYKMDADDEGREVFSLDDPDEISYLFEDGFMNWRNPHKFILYLDQIGLLKDPKEEEIREIKEEWKRHGVLTKQAFREEKWDVYNYDVLGNEEDGFEVNDVFRWGFVILPENPTLAQVIENLQRVDFLSEIAIVESIREDGDEDTIYLDDANNNFPLCQLRRREVVSDTKREQELKEIMEEWKRHDTQSSFKVQEINNGYFVVVNKKNYQVSPQFHNKENAEKYLKEEIPKRFGEQKSSAINEHLIKADSVRNLSQMTLLGLKQSLRNLEIMRDEADATKKYPNIDQTIARLKQEIDKREKLAIVIEHMTVQADDLML